MAVSLIVFACFFGGALLGVFLRVGLPKENLNPESRDVVKLAMGTIATMMAVVLGLLVASAKGYYDNQGRELTEMSAPGCLSGPPSDSITDRKRNRPAICCGSRLPAFSRGCGRSLQPCVPRWSLPLQAKSSWTRFRSCHRRTMPSAYSDPGVESGDGTRRNPLVDVRQANTSLSTPMLLVVIFALTNTFTSFSLHAAPNPTVVVTLVLCALAVSSTIFLILEVYQPFRGIIRIPSDPLRNALAHLGQ